MTTKNPAAAFGSKDRKRATAGLKRSGASRSGVAGARKKKNNTKKRAAQTGADTYQRLHLAKEAGKRLTKTQEKALQRHEASFLASHGLDKAAARKQAKEHDHRAKVIGRILGPTGRAGAVKISKADGEPFKASDLTAWRHAGWKIEAAGSVAGRVGAGGLAGTVVRPGDFEFHNPEPLGASGLARAIVICGPVDESLLLDLVADGYDVAPAPKRLRDTYTYKNPSPAPVQKKTYEAIVKAAKKRQALRVDELAELIKAPLAAVADAISRLLSLGLVHEAGRDLFGPCFAPGAPARGLFDNPTPGKLALKKAGAWYQKESLVDGVETIRLPHTVEAVRIGKIISITYESDKYDGHKRLWKHDVTGDKDLHISADGKVLVVLPGFQVTKQGIKG